MIDDRIEKIRAIIQHFADRGTEEYKESRNVETDAGYWHGYADCANGLLVKIDSLQEEPKLLTGKTKLEKIMAVADNMPRATLALSPTDNAVSSDWERRMVDAAESLGVSQVDYNKAIDELIYGKEEPVHRTKADVDAAMQDVEEKSKAFTDAHKGESAEEILVGMKGIDPSIQDIVDKHWFEMLGEEPILEVLAKYLDRVSKEEAMKTKGAIDRWFKEYFPEPVSEELEDAADKYSQSIHSDYSNDMFDSYNIYDAVIYGAQWQMSQMLKDATETTVHIDAGNYPYIPQIELYDYDKDVPLAKEGDMYKVVLIKEE